MERVSNACMHCINTLPNVMIMIQHFHVVLYIINTMEVYKESVNNQKPSQSQSLQVSSFTRV